MMKREGARRMKSKKGNEGIRESMAQGYTLAPLLRAAMIAVLSISLLLGHAGAASLSREEIRDSMYMHIKETFGYEQEALVEITLETYQQDWMFSVRIKDHPSTNDGIIAGGMNSEGMLLSIVAPYEYNLNMQVVSSFDRCIASIEGMFAFKQEWEPKRQDLIERILQEQNSGSDPQFLKNMVLLISEINLPSEEDISKNEALEKAKEQITAHTGWPRVKLDYFALKGEAYLNPQDTGKPVYQFIFSRRKRTAEEMNGGAAGRAFDMYQKDFYAAFGGQQSTPEFISVRIDARTGDVLEEPYIVYPEDMINFDYRDLLTR